MAHKNKTMKKNNKKKSFRDQGINEEMRKQDAKRKKAVQEMPIWKKVGGIMLIPVLISFWLVDRALFLFMLHAPHPSFKQYALEKSSMKMTIARCIIFGLPVFIFWLIFK